MREFYKGYEIEAIRKQGDESMFSRIIGWKAFYGKTLVADFSSKNELKKFLKSNPPSKLRGQGLITKKKAV